MKLHNSVFLSRVGMFIFFMLSVLLGLFWYEEAYVTTIVSFHDANILSETTAPIRALVSGSPLKGSVKALHNNFGTIRFRFTTYGRLNEDTIHFRLREKGMTDWMVSNSHRTNIFSNGGMYPIGFPVLADSKGKTYEFELESETGTRQNSVGILTTYHPVASQYIYTRESLSGKPGDLIQFAIEKVQSLASDASFQIYILLFIIPTIFWISLVYWHSMTAKFIIGVFSSLYMHIVFFYLPVSMNNNIILFIVFSDIYIFANSAYPLIVERVHNVLKVKMSVDELLSVYAFLLAIIFTLLIPVNLMLNLEIAASRVSVGAMYLTIFGIFALLRAVFLPNNQPSHPKNVSVKSPLLKKQVRSMQKKK